ncbi:MAG TPA: class I SAM-dependent methyltransferase [Bryobacteraceae bacterium]|jgi:trans-aconitate methyltransferase|nr:class I SAM-dependent methyltransferase [Bryobacteraceae bacterium]
MASLWDSSLYDDRHSFVWKKSADLIDLLNPRPGERILDLGCGTGHLTAQIAERGVEVLGIDSSPAMIGQARQNYPANRTQAKFLLADARNFHFEQSFDAVFSNAALHWIPDPAAVIASVAAALKPGGRFVLEMGARGNIATIVTVLDKVLREAGYVPENPWFFPSAAEYATLLEQQGFEIQALSTFERWHKLEHPERGLREWLEMFAGSWFKSVPMPSRPALIAEIEARLAPLLRCENSWYADYRRLRVIASAACLPLRTQSGIPIP